MQNFKSKFLDPDGSKLATLQTCIRTNDLSLLGDGTHLSLFHMLGNFHFGYPEDRDNYKNAIIMWDEIIKTLKIPVTSIHVHPTQDEHKQLWINLGYEIILDEECTWTDGAIGGYSTEFYVGDLEVGNLVNTLGYSVDVGIGFERLQAILEGKSRIDESSLFNQDLSPILRDIDRTLTLFYQLNIYPGYRDRHQVCRNLLRKILDIIPESYTPVYQEWVDKEQKAIQSKSEMARKVFYRHRDKSIDFFKITYGIDEDIYFKIKAEFTDVNGNIIRITKDG